MQKWQGEFKSDPINFLKETENSAVRLYVERDLLEQKRDIKQLWKLPDVKKLLKKQQEDGSWSYPSKKPRFENYNLFETCKVTGFLVVKYGLDRTHEAIQCARDYFLSCQTTEGDYRGIYGNQYSPNYTGNILETLIQAGFHDDSSVHKAFSWLISMRQDDGGWAIPIRTRELSGIKWNDDLHRGPTLQPDKTRPFSHYVTGVVLRALALHPHYRQSREARDAAALLKSRLFYLLKPGEA